MSEFQPMHKNHMSILSLPKDILAVIFSKLWRIEAKGVPLTCKMFSQVISSRRYFNNNFKHFTIRIQQLPDSLARSLLRAAEKVDLSHFRDAEANKANAQSMLKHPKSAIVKYDHFDTPNTLLNRFQQENETTWPDCKKACLSLYANSAHGRLHAFQDEHNSLLEELEFLPQENRETLYTSDFSWRELNESLLTWSDVMSQIFATQKKLEE